MAQEYQIGQVVEYIRYPQGLTAQVAIVIVAPHRTHCLFRIDGVSDTILGVSYSGIEHKDDLYMGTSAFSNFGYPISILQSELDSLGAQVYTGAFPAVVQQPIQMNINLVISGILAVSILAMFVKIMMDEIKGKRKSK